jgi:hypothetical protein
LIIMMCTPLVMCNAMTIHSSSLPFHYLTSQP